MATENLKVKITADANQAKAEIGKFKDSLKDTVKQGDSATKMLKRVTAASATLAATIKITKAAIKSAIATAAVGDAIKDNAQKVFMGTTAYQEWGYVLKQNGIEMGAMKVAMRKFSQEVATGSEALAKYGITATDVDTAFSQAIATIQGMSSETEKIAAATELFGARALELMPVLNLTNAETKNLMQSYRLLGGTMSNELIASSDTCTDSITAMKAAWGGLKNVLAAYVIPVVTKVVQWITIAIAKVRILLSAIFGIKETFNSGGKKSIASTSASVAKSTGGMAKNLKKATKHAKELRRTLMGIDELSKLAEKATAAASSGSGGGGGGSVSIPAVSDDIGSVGEILSDEQMTKLQEFKDLIDKISPVLNGIYKIMKGLVEISFGNFTQGLKDIKDGIAKLIPDSVKKKWEEFKASVKEKIETFITVTWPDFKTDIKNKWDEFKKNFAEVAAKVGINIPTWDEIKAKWDELKANFQNIAPNVSFKIPKWDDIKKDWLDLKKKFKGKKVKISIDFPDWKKDLKKKWESLKSKFKNIKKSVTLDFTSQASSLKSWINSNVIAKINNTLHKVPILKNVSVPYLAKGGVLTAPTTALMAEYPGARSNPEIATPQSLMAETIRDANGDLVSAFAQMTRQVITAIENQDLSVKIGDETIARSAQRGNTAYYNRTGKALLTI